ncbi:HK97 family phage prohead protease [Spiroplasma endosymbiont of Polydrusus formosus]
MKGNIVRYLKKVEVNEVSLVPLGANPKSEVQ